MVIDALRKPLELDRRDLVPPQGLREFWYPAIQAKEVGKKPVKLRMLGEELCFFRGSEGKVAALWDVCPHRGASLSEGDCHYRGTVACPYHGWVFDGDGECLAVLSEGPTSGIPGKARARSHPTRELKGMVFVWMGEEEPAPIEEDVPVKKMYPWNSLKRTACCSIGAPIGRSTGALPWKTRWTPMYITCTGTPSTS